MVRIGTLEDLQAIAGFDPFGGDRSAEAREGRHWIEEDVAGNVVGYASVARCSFHGNPYVEFLSVRPDARRSGVLGERNNRS
jgi:hypothetical protein